MSRCDQQVAEKEKQQQINRVSVTIHGFQSYCDASCLFMFEEVGRSHILMQLPLLISQSNLLYTLDGKMGVM